MTKRLLHSFVVAAALLASGVAGAQDQGPALPEPVTAQPTPGNKQQSEEGEPEIALDVDREIDLANVVTSAAKGVTTVQEAPAIITIITSDEIKARGWKWALEALGSVPGWQDIHAVGNQVSNPMVRGVAQAFLLMRDGLSLFDPWGNLAWIGRTQPLENVKRIEVVTGPGGVLWGANSFLGIANFITKDAEDVNGLELDAGYGDGPGNKQDFKAYALFGKTFLNGKLKIFQHLSYETFIGETFNDYPQFLVSAPAPQPGGLAYFTTPRPRDPTRSWFVTVDGKYSLGPFTLYYMVPFGDVHPLLGFANVMVQGDNWNQYDRYGVLEYKDRFAKDRIGLTVKAYGVQFVHDLDIQLFPSSSFFPQNPMDPKDRGGLHFGFVGQKVFRFGGTVDLDVNLPFQLKLLAGGEFYYEGMRDSNSIFSDPTAADLPILCPVMDNGNGTFTRINFCPRQYGLNTGRFVAAGYVDAQWHPIQKLSVDGGVRIQKGFGDNNANDLSYNLVPLGSAAIVYNFLPDFHVKLNYATGFRAPVFQNTSIPPGGVSYGANPSLKTESSQSFQGELNARLLRNVRKIRELELRADYSYTVLTDVLEIRNGTYGNTGKRAIHSAEGYAKLYLNGDHFLQASYTYLHSETTDVGVDRSIPNHFISLGGSFNIIKNLLWLNFNLNVFGAYEDPNRYASATGGPAGGEFGNQIGTTTARTSDITLDRLTPVADLQLGFRLQFLKDKLQFSGQFYNVLNQRYYYPDNFNDLTPTIEMTPEPAPGFNFFANLSYHF